MSCRTYSNLELLSLLVGEKRAEKMYQGSLAALLHHAAQGDAEYRRIAAARELIQRALEEDLERGTALASPQAVRDYLRLLFVGKEHEVFVLICLDAQNCIIETDELFHGTLTQTSVYPREVVKRALRHNAAAVIFAHNHPSGVAEQSRADEMLTQTLKSALNLIEVRVLDHFVVAGSSCLSFAERGLL